jgi:ribose-phosphate pyrophosphokinase
MSDSRSQALLLGFPDYAAAAERLARAAALPYAKVEVHHFPDGESRVRLPTALPAHTILCRSLDRPNEKLLELALAAGTARKLGAERLTLVAPYLCYMRQDTAFQPGEAVSQRIIGLMLADWFDTLVTVDPHLHRVHSLQEAVPVRRPVALSAAVSMAAFLAHRFPRPMLIGPDAESEQWVAAIARLQGFDYRVGSKERLGDQQVRVSMPAARYRGRDLVIVDDVVSTGCSLEAVARQLKAQGPASLSVLVTHALFLEGAVERLRAAGVEHIWSSDSIAHPSNCLPLAELLAGALSCCAGKPSPHHP